MFYVGACCFRSRFCFCFCFCFLDSLIWLWFQFLVCCFSRDVFLGLGARCLVRLGTGRGVSVCRKKSDIPVVHFRHLLCALEVCAGRDLGGSQGVFYGFRFRLFRLLRLPTAVVVLTWEEGPGEGMPDRDPLAVIRVGDVDRVAPAGGIRGAMRDRRRRGNLGRDHYR